MLCSRRMSSVLRIVPTYGVRPTLSSDGHPGFRRLLSTRYETCSTFQHKADEQISLTLILIILTPILGVVFYAAYSTPPTPARTIQPGSTILPIALFTSSLSLILLLPNISSEALVVPLLPLSLMSCMRGGKDDLGDGAEWEWTVLLHTVVTS